MKISDLLESQRLINLNIAKDKLSESSVEDEKPVKRKPRKKAVVADTEDKDEE